MFISCLVYQNDNLFPATRIVVAANFVGADVPLDCCKAILVDGLFSRECPDFVDNADLVGGLGTHLRLVECEGTELGFPLVDGLV